MFILVHDTEEHNAMNEVEILKALREAYNRLDAYTTHPSRLTRELVLNATRKEIKRLEQDLDEVTRNR